MKFRTVFLVLLLALFVAFTILNWSAFTAPTTLKVLVGTVEAPLGLLLLGVIVLFAAVFLLLLGLQQATVLVETRRAAKELTAQRALADQAEASRFTALQQHLDEATRRSDAQAAARHEALERRLEQLEHVVREQIEQAGNSLAADIGVMDDRLERLVAVRALPGPSR